MPAYPVNVRSYVKWATAKATLYRTDGHQVPPSVSSLFDWIDIHMVPQKTAHRKFSSYFFKHRAEEALGEYVSNGDFIEAMLLKGYEIYPTDPERVGPNYYFNCGFTPAGKLMAKAWNIRPGQPGSAYLEGATVPAGSGFRGFGRGGFTPGESSDGEVKALN